MKKQEVIISNPLVDSKITSKIVVIRDVQVMIDRDLAELYEIETKRLKEQVNRNINRFPASFMFQLDDEEFQNLRSHLRPQVGAVYVMHLMPLLSKA